MVTRVPAPARQVRVKEVVCASRLDQRLQARNGIAWIYLGNYSDALDPLLIVLVPKGIEHTMYNDE